MLNPALQTALTAACRVAGEPRLVIVFGSIARGHPRPDSDLDIAIDLRTAGVPLVGEILQGGERLLGDAAAHGALMARHVTDVEDFMPAYRRLMATRLSGWMPR